MILERSSKVNGKRIAHRKGRVSGFSVFRLINRSSQHHALTVELWGFLLQFLKRRPLSQYFPWGPFSLGAQRKSGNRVSLPWDIWIMLNENMLAGASYPTKSGPYFKTAI